MEQKGRHDRGGSTRYSLIVSGGSPMKGNHEFVKEWGGISNVLVLEGRGKQANIDKEQPTNLVERRGLFEAVHT